MSEGRRRARQVDKGSKTEGRKGEYEKGCKWRRLNREIKRVWSRGRKRGKQMGKKRKVEK